MIPSACRGPDPTRPHAHGAHKAYAHRWLARICQQDAAVTSNATSSGQQSAAATHDAIASISQHCAEVTSDATDRRAVVTTQTDTISRCLSLQATAWEMNCSSRPDSSPIPASSRKTMFKPGCILCFKKKKTCVENINWGCKNLWWL